MTRFDEEEEEEFRSYLIRIRVLITCLHMSQNLMNQKLFLYLPSGRDQSAKMKRVQYFQTTNSPVSSPSGYAPVKRAPSDKKEKKKPETRHTDPNKKIRNSSISNLANNV